LHYRALFGPWRFLSVDLEDYLRQSLHDAARKESRRSA
jgi:hypothetical protein